MDHRLSLFKKFGARECVVVKFDRAFSRVSARRFLNELLRRRLAMRSLSVGRGFRYGRRAEGGEKDLWDASRRHLFRFNCLEPLRVSGGVISSTRIRRLILRGKLKEASALLGRPYTVVGTVVAGRGRGKRTGFPTANLDPHHEILPPDGVYAALGRIGAEIHPAAVSIGPRPTFDDGEKALEVHFPGLSRRLYGRDVELDFRRRLRGLRRFAGPRELAAAIRTDVKRTLTLLG